MPKNQILCIIKKQMENQAEAAELGVCITSVSSGIQEVKCMLRGRQNEIYRVDRSYLCAFKACQHSFSENSKRFRETGVKFNQLMENARGTC